jgi:hypothetical protein
MVVASASISAGVLADAPTESSNLIAQYGHFMLVSSPNVGWRTINLIAQYGHFILYI